MYLFSSFRHRNCILKPVLQKIPGNFTFRPEPIFCYELINTQDLLAIFVYLPFCISFTAFPTFPALSLPGDHLIWFLGFNANAIAYFPHFRWSSQAPLLFLSGIWQYVVPLFFSPETPVILNSSRWMNSSISLIPEFSFRLFFETTLIKDKVRFFLKISFQRLSTIFKNQMLLNFGLQYFFDE